MLKAIIFDMDDTLLDWSGEDIEWTEFHRVHTRYVLDYVEKHVGPVNGDHESILTTMLDLTRDAWRDARDTLRAPHIGHILVDTFLEFGVSADALDVDAMVDAYQWQPLPGVRPFDDVYDSLSLLREQGLKLGLVTNAFQPMRSRIKELDAFNLVQFFERDAMISAADVGYLKPHARIFEDILTRLDVAANQSVFVGDSREADILGAKNAGMKGVLRTRPDSTAILGNKIKPDGQIMTLYDLPPLLDDWFPGWR